MGAIRSAKRIGAEVSTEKHEALAKQWRAAKSLEQEIGAVRQAIETKLKDAIYDLACAKRSKKVKIDGLKIVFRRNKVGKAGLDESLVKKHRIPVSREGGGVRVVFNNDLLEDDELIDEIEKRLEGLDVELFYEEEVPEKVKLGEKAIERALRVKDRRAVLPAVANVTLTMDGEAEGTWDERKSLATGT